MERPLGRRRPAWPSPRGRLWLLLLLGLLLSPAGILLQNWDNRGADSGGPTSTQAVLAEMRKDRVAREAALGSAAPASTLFVVAGLASPDWLVEIEVIAAAPS